ncbi:hypothetical protein Acr_24g0015270 [Actinidia rufa]|uniref:Uncharacterized protein n=1 Tax=Actinidia rufa TaxID=165716 RepID=A0A7J0GWW4_9ERIC|nr:hypothetical protein Acr_24g0015270 [Actinidia rufa]
MINCRCLRLVTWAIRRNSIVQVTFYPLSSLGNTTGRFLSPKLSSLYIITSSIGGGISNETKVLARTVSGSDCSKLRRKGSLRSFSNDDSTGVSALVRPVVNSICTELRRKKLPSLSFDNSSVEVPALVRPNYRVV